MTASVPGASNQSGKPRAAGARFPPDMRLLRHADFERVYKRGRRHFSASMTVFYLPRPEETQEARRARGREAATRGLRVGFTVGRALGGAVDRNRMKRRLREATRLAPPPAKVSADVVINPKKSFLATDFEAVLNEIRRAFVVIEQKLEGKGAKEKA
ncbi:MAG TPA: ribonuclease P protein component [Candidatus Sulfotelmatobacter sp.]|nr:ribonuclease P protein component [Candidatus Sulfotelmatobacter sp.]